MSRWNTLTQCALAVLLPVLRPGTATAEPDALDTERAMAKARFAADQATPAELTRQLVEAVRDWQQRQYDKYCAGTITPDLALEPSMFLMKAELLAQVRPSPRPLLEQTWRQTWQASELAESKYRAGRASIADVGQTRAERLTVELELARLREKKPEK
jgi:hypothetical protein